MIGRSRDFCPGGSKIYDMLLITALAVNHCDHDFSTLSSDLSESHRSPTPPRLGLGSLGPDGWTRWLAMCLTITWSIVSYLSGLISQRRTFGNNLSIITDAISVANHLKAPLKNFSTDSNQWKSIITGLIQYWRQLKAECCTPLSSLSSAGTLLTSNTTATIFMAIFRRTLLKPQFHSSSFLIASS